MSEDKVAERARVRFTPARLPEEPDEIESYRPLSGLAVVATLLGLASPLALFAPFLWVLPLGGLLASLGALRAIGSMVPPMLGRKGALAGLALSLIFGVAGPVDWACYRWQIRREATRFAMQWFDFLRASEPHKAFQLRLAAETRSPLDDSLWQVYYEGSDLRQMLEEFLRDKAVRTLMALGQKATIRYFDTEAQEGGREADIVEQSYAVTYPGPEGPTTFFVSLRMERSQPRDSDRAFWRVINHRGGIRPRALGGSGEEW